MRWAPSVVDDSNFFFNSCFFFFPPIFLLLMWRRAPSTSRRQLVPDVVDISERPSLFSPLGTSRVSSADCIRLRSRRPPTTHYNYMPISAVFLFHLIALVTRLHTPWRKLITLSTIRFGRVIFLSLFASCFPPAFHSAEHVSLIPSGNFRVYLGTNTFFFLYLSTKWKTSFRGNILTKF